MNLNGKPYLPPDCPQHWDGLPFDIRAAAPVYVVDDGDTDGSVQNGRQASLVFSFDHTPPHGHQYSRLMAAPVIVDADSPVAQKALELAVNDPGAAQRLGDIFCKRVLACKGQVQGNCWALGANALSEVIESTPIQPEC